MNFDIIFPVIDDLKSAIKVRIEGGGSELL